MQLRSVLWSSSLAAPSTVTAVITVTCAQGQPRPITYAQGRLRSITCARGQLRPITCARGWLRPITCARGWLRPITCARGQLRLITCARGQLGPITCARGQLRPIASERLHLLTSYGLEGPRNRRHLWAGLTFCEMKSSTSPVKAGGAPFPLPRS